MTEVQIRELMPPPTAPLSFIERSGHTRHAAINLLVPIIILPLSSRPRTQELGRWVC